MESRLTASASPRITGFSGQYRGSVKESDFVHIFDHKPIFILEVGFSEKYEDLKMDVRLWIEGQESVTLVGIVGLQETPTYKNPAANLTKQSFGL